MILLVFESIDILYFCSERDSVAFSLLVFHIFISIFFHLTIYLKEEAEHTVEHKNVALDLEACEVRVSGKTVPFTYKEYELIKLESAHGTSQKCVFIVTHSHELAKWADVIFHLKRGELKVQ